MSSLPLPIAAFVAGLFSFLSPCVLPLVPGYISLVSGVSVEELQSQDRTLLRTMLLHSCMFVLGFTVVFVVLGAAATQVGQLVQEYKKYLIWVAGAMIIIFGLHLTGIFKIRALYIDKRLHSVKGGKTPIGAFVIGFAFAFGWTPCIGPVLATILTLAGNTNSVGKGVFLLWVYSLGLAVPFLLTSIGMGRFLNFYGWFRRHLHTVEVTSGVLLIAIGALIMTGHFTWLSSRLGWLNRFVW
jgi:cytochrome c-type biogenesis protein